MLSQDLRRRSGLRLLHVAPMPPPWSGIGVSVQQLLASGPFKPHAIWVLDSSTGAIPHASGRRKLPTLARVTRHARLAMQVLRMTRRWNIHVVHLHGSSDDLSFVANWLSVGVARSGGARTVWHLHQDLETVLFPGRRRVTRGVFAAAVGTADAVAVMTHKDQEIAAALVDPRRIVVIPPVCSPDMLSIPLERRDRCDSFRVLYVGWLNQMKGIYDLLAAAIRVRECFPNMTFDVVGVGRHGGDADAVRAFVQQHGLERQVKLCGLVVGEAKRRMFADAHALFIPTYRDAFPVVVLEAMAAGLPVVGSRVGGVPTMLDGGGGLLANPGDVAHMVDSLVRLAQDDCLRSSMGRLNRQKFVGHYHPDTIGQRVIDLYERLVA